MSSTLKWHPGTTKPVRVMSALVGIPDFNGGLLPAGSLAGPIEVLDVETDEHVLVNTRFGHQCTEAEIHERFVEQYPDTQTRHAIHFELMQHIRLAGEYLPCAAFFISGQFVADIQDPENAHLVVVATGEALHALSSFNQWVVERTFADRQAHFGGGQELTTQLVTVYPHGHDRWATAVGDMAVARHFCGNPLEDDNEGGYLQLIQCEGGGPDAPIISLLAGASLPS